MSRVKSKHLFNYQLNGVLGIEALNYNKYMQDIHSADPELQAMKKLTYSDDPEDVEVCVEYTRKRYRQMKSSDTMQMFTDESAPFFKQCTDQCTHTVLNVPPCDDNDFEVPVLVHTPTHLKEERTNAAVIYAHGGGVIATDANTWKGWASHLAIEAGVVFFNVDFRMAPEAKVPKNALDYYCAVKHIIENAQELGIDASRIAIAGDSGGGYIVIATMVMLAQKDESSLIKLAIPGIPMIDDYCFNDIASMTKDERANAPQMKKVWHCIANDLTAERNDPLLFPSKASDEILQKMPPTIIWEYEFDIFITEATRMAHRLRTAGRLLEFRVQPGMTHISAFVPGTEAHKINSEDYKLAIKEYLL